jgi:hypothetical protein
VDVFMEEKGGKSSDSEVGGELRGEEEGRTCRP